MAALAQAVYRSIARLSKRGAAPEVIPWQALQYASRHDDKACVAMLAAASRSPVACTTILKDAWTDSTTGVSDNWNDPLNFLRNTALLAHALRPTTLPMWLPAIVDDCTILPGERRRLIFDAELVEHAMRDADRRVVHLTRRPGISQHPEHVEAASTADDAIGCVLTILNARPMFGRLVAECVAGPRCSITDRQHTQTAEGAFLSVAPRLFPEQGAPPDGSRADEHTSRLTMELAERVLTEPSAIRIFGRVGMVPPFHCPERFSFFLCGLLMHDKDVNHRLEAMHATTAERLTYCREAIDAGGWAELMVFAAAEEDDSAGQGSLRPWEVAEGAVHPARSPDPHRALRRREMRMRGVYNKE